MNSKEQVEEFSSDAEFDDDEAGTESSSDIDAKLEEDDVFDVEFFKCYSALKKKDDKIYDEKVKFFTERDEASDSDADKDGTDGHIEGTSLLGLNSKKSSAPKMTLLDHQLALAQNEFEESESATRTAKIDLTEPVSKSFYDKELEEIKRSIEKVSENVDSESDDDLLIVKSKDGERPVKSKSRKALSSILDKLEGAEDEDINHLKQVWSDPDNLTEEERFLRDYILNKRYLPKSAHDSENDGDDDDDKGGFFSKNLEGLPDNDLEPGPSKTKSDRPVHHSEEKDFDTLVRIPRNSTKTIRDMVEKREKQEKRQKKLEKEKKKKKNLKDADFEDLVGDLPTRFHYRETEPNDYGLSAEELLMATDEELDQWVNLKQAIAYKTQEEELAEKARFEQKRNDIALKRKIFKSIYGEEGTEAKESQNSQIKPKGKKKKRNRDSESSNVDQDGNDIESAGGVQEEEEEEEEEVQESNRKRKKKNKRRGLNHKKFAKTGVAPDRLLAYGLSKTKLKKSKLL